MFILDFVLVDKSFSLRDVMSMKKEALPYIEMMTTTNVGMLLPEVLEEFGENRKVDMMFTTSHALISAKLPDVKTSGFQMDKNGNFRFVINLGIEIAVEKGFKQYEEARSIYVSLVAKGKVVIKEETNKKGVSERKLVMMAKAFEIGNCKIYKADGEEMVVEQMVLTSGVNVQMEQMIKMMLKPYEIPIKSIPYPKEMECLGVQLSDLDLKFRKGFMEMSIDYTEVETMTGPSCVEFLTALREGPKRLKDTADSVLGDQTWREYMEDRRDMVHSEDSEELAKDMADL